MDALLIEAPTAAPASSGALLGDVALARVASGAGHASKSEVARDLGPLAAHGKAAADWKAVFERVLADLVADGCIEIAGLRITATRKGQTRATAFLAVAGWPLPEWSALRAGALIAKALGIERASLTQLKALLKGDGLAAAIVVRAFKLKIKGTASASRLRAALSVIALERAFGNQIKAGFGGKSGMSPKASRLLAAQLTRRQKDPGTDSRLIAILAAEAMGLKQPDLKSLQLAVLRQWIGGGEKAKLRKPVTKPAPVRSGAPAAPRPSSAAPPVAPQIVDAASRAERPSQRPAFESFVTAVQAAALARASGWSGNRKAYISHVWQQLQISQPAWAITDIEFKAMLAEAHRMGRIALSTADLKDPNAIKDVQGSALAYRNAVFHFVRVDQ